MKRTVIILLTMVISLGVWASETVIFSHNTLAYEPIGEIQVSITDDMMDIFESYVEDYVEDYYDNYEDLDVYLGSDYDLNLIPKGVIDYLFIILSGNVDGVKDLIYDELKANLTRGKTEFSTMTIGPYQFNATMDYPL